jgi:riboflavin synthase
VFTGLVEGTARVLAFERRSAGARILLEAPRLPPEAPPWNPSVGESIAVSGCCLTVAELTGAGATGYDLSAETLSWTWFSALEAERQEERSVNVERSLRLGDRLGGHLVSGHVDGRGRIVAVEDTGDGGRRAAFEVEPGFERFLLDKGSVTVDGVSLTVVAPRGRRFEVALVPETLRRTTLGRAAPAASVHLEADMIGKWIERLLAERG